MDVMNMEILAKPVQTVIVISGDKAKEFLSKKADPNIKARILERARKMREHTTLSK